MTFPIAETVKEAVAKSEAKTRATFIANRKEVLIKKWWAEFNEENEKTFEEIYSGWEIDAHFGILSQSYTIPSLEDCCDELNHTKTDWKSFNDYFQEHFKLKK